MKITYNDEQVEYITKRYKIHSESEYSKDHVCVENAHISGRTVYVTDRLRPLEITEFVEYSECPISGIAHGKIHFDQYQNPIASLEDAFFINFDAANHYGHFLVDTMARMGPLLTSPPCKNVIVRYVPVGLGTHTGSNAYIIYKILQEKFGLNIIKTEAPLYVKKLYVPVPTMSDGCYIYPQHLHNLKKIGEYYCESHRKDLPVWDKIYISRGNINRRVMECEVELQGKLKAAGWKIIHPEKLPMHYQIKIFKHAKHIASTSGSALHTLMLTGSGGKKITTIINQPVSWPNFPAQHHFQGNDVQYLYYQHLNDVNPDDVFNQIQQHHE